MKRKLILFGIDGAPWSLIDRFVDQGCMPNFKHVLDNGVKGTLMSTFPYNTLPAWTSIFTGVNPGKHGMIDFRMRIDGKFVTIHPRNEKIMSLWQILTKYGSKSIVVNNPVTYFPEKINGIMTTGLLTLSGTRYVEPANLAEEIDDVAGGYIYELPLEFYRIVVDDKTAAYKMIEDMAKKHARVALHLAKKYEWDVLAPIFTSTDRLQHFFWNEQDLIKKHYILIDNILGDFIKIANEQQANLLIMSDHGFGPHRKTFHVNTWLENIGLLVTRKSVLASLLSALGLRRERITKILGKLHLYNFAYNMATKRFKALEETAMFFDKQIDFLRSKAYTESKFGIFLNENLKGEDYENVMEMVIRKLYEVQDDGVKLVEKVLRREEVMDGPYASSAPDLFVITAKGYEFSYHGSKDLFGIPKDIKGGAVRDGCHRLEGIFAACGPDIKEGINISETLRTYDIMPTILGILGLPTPAYADGKIIDKIFKSEILLEREAVHESMPNETERIKNRLSKLRK